MWVGDDGGNVRFECAAADLLPPNKSNAPSLPTSPSRPRTVSPPHATWARSCRGYSPIGRRRGCHGETGVRASRSEENGERVWHYGFVLGGEDGHQAFRKLLGLRCQNPGRQAAMYHQASKEGQARYARLFTKPFFQAMERVSSSAPSPPSSFSLSSSAGMTRQRGGNEGGLPRFGQANPPPAAPQSTFFTGHTSTGNGRWERGRAPTTTATMPPPAGHGQRTHQSTNTY